MHDLSSWKLVAHYTYDQITQFSEIAEHLYYTEIFHCTGLDYYQDEMNVKVFISRECIICIYQHCAVVVDRNTMSFTAFSDPAVKPAYWQEHDAEKIVPYLFFNEFENRKLQLRDLIDRAVVVFVPSPNDGNNGPSAWNLF